MDKKTSSKDELFMTLFEAAMTRPTSQRPAFIRKQCGSDKNLCASLLRLMKWEEKMGDFLQSPLVRFPEAERPFRPGDRAIERFRIVREIGEGGMAVVYEAIDEKQEERRALKCAKPGFHPRLPPEARAAMRVTHENVCRVHEIHTAQTERGPLDFLAMEFLEGKTLAEYLEGKERLSSEEAREILEQICKGLAAAHRKLVLHRDLKSNNIMLTRAGEEGTLRV